MDKSVINVGVIGLGEQGWDNLLPSLAVLKDANIQAVCDLDEERLEAASRNYGAVKYTNFIKMIDTENLDAVVVASHPNVHADVLRITLARQLPTFIEKPPTLSTSELQELIDLNDKFQTVTAVGLNFSFTEPVQFIKQMMQREEFGSLQYLRVCHYGNKPDAPMWGLDTLSRSFLLSQAIHPLGLFYDLGKDIGVEPTIHAHKGEAGLLFNVKTQLQAKSGNNFTAELLTCSSSPFFEWQMQLISDKGVMINVNSLWEVEVYSMYRKNPLIDNQKWWRDMWRPSPLSGGFKRNGYQHQFSAFFDNIRANKTNGTAIERMMPIYNLMDKMEQVCEQ